MPLKVVKPALLVLDCQNYFLDPRSHKYLKGSRAIVPRINLLTRAYREAGRPVIYTVHRAPQRKGNLMPERYRHLPTGKECRLWHEVMVPPESVIVAKEHYSAFQDTALAARLRRMGITDILLCGVMTHLCVDTTARHGFMLGFRPTVIGDACCSKSQAYHRAALLTLEHGFAKIATAQQICRHARKDR